MQIVSNKQRNKRPNNQRRWWNTAIVAGAVSLLLGIGYGVLGNRADAIFVFLFGWLITSIGTNFWPWIIICVVIIICLVAIFLLLRHSANRIAILDRARESSSNMAALDDSLLRLLATWVPPSVAERDNQVKRILREMLSDATVEFNGHVQRAAILLPERDYLKCWASYQMPVESVTDMRFYIGSEQAKIFAEGGIAGQAFLHGEIIVGHMKRINDQWVVDNEHYIKFDRIHHFPPYISFVCVPIVGINTAGNVAGPIGVLCFDSHDENVFDSEEVKTVLRAFARRVAAAILICKKLPGA